MERENQSCKEDSEVAVIFVHSGVDSVLVPLSFVSRRSLQGGVFSFVWREMQKQSLMVDAWMREAQEALKLVEDVETRVKNKNPHQEEEEEDENLRLTEIARSKLFEVGVKVDRLESLLRNPPSKPILTNEDLEYRWKMLSDIQLRTRVLALSLYAIPSPNRPESLPTACTVENIRTVNRDEPDQMKASISEDDPEMLRPLIYLLFLSSHSQTVKKAKCR
ncbi:hypothetical protein SLEP1_g36539 [Rubroshorea leprosula]|uniref:Uncharacterized protein n=1 Tax=Rubroshorea leprosula TaxID=152421 RepID=A0AAV5KS22_9ROSI|nr:hypothetical protein SLEP1_g36539 [Rubroshorea leprosula]